jgi:uroporphyrinogen-III synthase
MRSPIEGRRIVVTRAEKQAMEMIQLIEAKGAKAYLFPVIKTEWASDLSSLDQAIHKLEQFDWIFFTSVNGVDYFFERVQEVRLNQHPDLDLEALLKGISIAAIGVKTAKAIESWGLTVSVVPPSFKQEKLFEACKRKMESGMRVLYPRAKVVRQQLSQQLRESGLRVEEVEVYQTTSAENEKDEFLQSLSMGEIDAITFTSSSTVSRFVAILEDGALKQRWRELLATVDIACIGPITAQTAKQLGLRVAIEAEEYTVEGLLNQIEEFYKKRRG